MSIEQDLRRKLRKLGLEKAYDASIVCDAAKKVAKGRFSPISFKRGVLKIFVSSPAKASLLKLQEESIIKEVEEASNARINRLIFTLTQDDPCNKN